MRSDKHQDPAEEKNGGSIEDTRAGTAGAPRRIKLSSAWLAAAAACICLLIAGAVFIVIKAGILPDYEEDCVDNAVMTDHIVTGQSAVGIYIDGYDDLCWSPITFDERLRYELLPPGSEGLTPENTYHITEADLGEPMGTVSGYGDETLAGNTVYHYAARPGSLGICIVDTGGGSYEFYCAAGLYIQGDSSIESLLDRYGFPGECAYIEIQQSDGTPIFRITDRDRIELFCELISGRENIGNEEAERRFAKAWYDAYGNDDVYYSEADGCCAYRGDGTESEEITYTEDDGTEVTEYVYPEGYTDIYDTAHELWNEGERCIFFCGRNDLGFDADYFPSIGVMFSYDRQYDIPADAAARLAELIYPEQ